MVGTGGVAGEGAGFVAGCEIFYADGGDGGETGGEGLAFVGVRWGCLGEGEGDERDVLVVAIFGCADGVAAADYYVCG